MVNQLIFIEITEPSQLSTMFWAKVSLQIGLWSMQRRITGHVRTLIRWLVIDVRVRCRKQRLRVDWDLKIIITTLRLRQLLPHLSSRRLECHRILLVLTKVDVKLLYLAYELLVMPNIQSVSQNRLPNDKPTQTTTNVANPFKSGPNLKHTKTIQLNVSKKQQNHSTRSIVQAAFTLAANLTSQNILYPARLRKPTGSNLFHYRWSWTKNKRNDRDTWKRSSCKNKRNTIGKSIVWWTISPSRLIK